MPKMTGSRLVAEVFKGYGVTHVFFVPTILMDALAEADSLGIQKILTHGEKAAAYMADGYARAKNAPGVCLAQQIGASNLAAGLRDPFMAHTPLIAITGGPQAGWRYRHAYQEVEDFEPVRLRDQAQSLPRRPRAPAGSAAADVPRGDLGRAGPGAPAAQGLARPGHRDGGGPAAVGRAAVRRRPAVPARRRGGARARGGRSARQGAEAHHRRRRRRGVLAGAGGAGRARGEAPGAGRDLSHREGRHLRRCIRCRSAFAALTRAPAPTRPCPRRTWSSSSAPTPAARSRRTGGFRRRARR